MKSKFKLYFGVLGRRDALAGKATIKTWHNMETDFVPGEETYVKLPHDGKTYYIEKTRYRLTSSNPTIVEIYLIEEDRFIGDTAQDTSHIDWEKSGTLKVTDGGITFGKGDCGIDVKPTVKITGGID